MPDHDDFFDSLPFSKDDAHQPTQDDTGEEALEAVQVEGGGESESDPRLGTERKEVVREPKKKKKKKVIKRKKILKKKKKKKPEDPPVEEGEIDEQEGEYDEGAEAEEPENFLDDEAEAEDEDEADKSTEVEAEPDLDEEDSPLATLPFAAKPDRREYKKGEEPGDSSSPEEPPKAQAVPPVDGEKRKVRTVKKKKKKKKTSTSHAEPVDRSEINKLWDEFLRSLNQATLIAVYEMGIGSILDFEKYSLGQLSKPRGHLTVAQAKEVETWLSKHNIKLNQSSVDSPIANIRGAGSRVTRGLRIPIKNITVSDDASVRDKRHARFTNTRATM